MSRGLAATTTFVVLIASLAARGAAAQGTLSTQGLGFPPGQLSTSALTMGGASGEVDALSPLNPAAIGILVTPILVFQAAPEFRTVRIGNQSLKSSVARFPLFMGSLPLGRRWGASASASTLLDRTWQTVVRDTQVLNGDSLRSTITQLSEGSIADLRLAVSFAPTAWMKIGVGGHGFTGRDLLRNIRRFDDSLRFARDTQQTVLSFGGNALSAGALINWRRLATIGVGYRHGGSLRAYSGRDVVGRGSAPDHYGVSVVYLGISGTTLGVRAARDTWSKLKGLSSTLNVHEGWDIGFGGDVTGPAFGGTPMAVRAGFRWRTLPFSVDSSAVKERTLSGGIALPLARRRAEVSIGALRSSRTSASGPSETAWTISTGFAVRP